MNVFEDLAATDAALDALGRGEPGPDGDALLGALALWRADLDEPAAPRVAPRRPRRLLVAAAAAVLITAGLGGVAAAAGDARPGSVLWPVTRIAYADRAESALAEDAADRLLAEADRALAEGRSADAARSLAAAEAQLSKIDSPDTVRRLRARLGVLRGRLAPGTEQATRSPDRRSAPVPTPSAGAVPASPDKRKPTPEPSEHGGGRSKGPDVPPTPANTKRPGEH
ncbi:hypothetical protein R8Z50_25775 [Longispora sp. K20-0274]|uniref:hypothetical protein n=1 Tax=Longispora sp. K20-0274 TaxID=3088255 RepID=UPI003999EC57